MLTSRWCDPPIRRASFRWSLPNPLPHVPALFQCVTCFIFGGPSSDKPLAILLYFRQPCLSTVWLLLILFGCCLALFCRCLADPQSSNRTVVLRLFPATFLSFSSDLTKDHHVVHVLSQLKTLPHVAQRKALAHEVHARTPNASSARVMLVLFSDRLYFLASGQHL